MKNIILFEKYPENNLIPVIDPRGNHILKILHLQKGDSFLMGVVNHASGRALITGINEEGISIEWKPMIPAESLFPVTLLVAQVRPICMKRILREAVSLGVEKIVVSGTDTGERSYRDAKLWKTNEYLEYLLSGAQQAGSASVPVVEQFSSVDSALQTLKSSSRNSIETPVSVVLDNIDQDARLSGMVFPEGRHYLLAIGPERGWSDRERVLFRKAGFLSAGLGSRILRTETACTAGLTLLLSRVGII